MTAKTQQERTYLITTMAEEATEVAEAASKVAQSIIKMLRFGEQDIYQEVTNWDRVQQELRELIALGEALGFDTTACPQKMIRVAHWLRYIQDKQATGSAVKS